MKKLLIVLAIAFMTNFGVDAQYSATKSYNVDENFTLPEIRKEKIPMWIKVVGVATVSTFLDAAGDALYDRGKIEGNSSDIAWGKALNTGGTGLLILSPFIFKDIDRSKWIWFGASNLLIRAGEFDLIYNGMRGLPIDYIGSTSLWDKTLKRFNPPRNTQLFARSVFLTAGVGIAINELRPKKLPYGTHSINSFSVIKDRKLVNPAIKPAVILMGTFVVNHFILKHDEKQNDFRFTSRKMGTVFIIGTTASLVTFSLECKKYKKRALPNNYSLPNNYF